MYQNDLMQSAIKGEHIERVTGHTYHELLVLNRSEQ